MRYCTKFYFTYKIANCLTRTTNYIMATLSLSSDKVIVKVIDTVSDTVSKLQSHYAERNSVTCRNWVTVTRRNTRSNLFAFQSLNCVFVVTNRKSVLPQGQVQTNQKNAVSTKHIKTPADPVDHLIQVSYSHQVHYSDLTSHSLNLSFSLRVTPC